MTPLHPSTRLTNAAKLAGYGIGSGIITGALCMPVSGITAGLAFGLLVILPFSFITGSTNDRRLVGVLTSTFAFVAAFVVNIGLSPLIANLTLASSDHDTLFTLVLLVPGFVGITLTLLPWILRDGPLDWSQATAPILVGTLTGPVAGLGFALQWHPFYAFGFIFVVWHAATAAALGYVAQPHRVTAWNAHPHYQSTRCSHCQYNLLYNTSGQCPECGTAIALEQRRELARLGEQHAAERGEVS